MRYWRTLSIICNLRRLSGRNSRTRWSSPMSIGRLHASAFPAWRSKGIFMSKLEKKVWVFVEYRKQNKQKTWFCFLYSTNLCNRNSLVQGGLAQSIEKIIENAVYLHLVRLGYEVTVGYLWMNCMRTRIIMASSICICDNSSFQRNCDNDR